MISEDPETIGLDTRHLFVVVREVKALDGRSIWTAHLGVGSYSTQVRRPAVMPAPGKREERQLARAATAKALGRRVQRLPERRGTMAFATELDATVAGVLAWRDAVTARVAEIKLLRGIDVAPREAPKVLVHAASSGSAWDALAAGNVAEDGPSVVD